VPLKRLDGFDAVMASLERLVAVPEQIPWMLTPGTGAWPDGVNNSVPSPHAVQFKPP
jgi:hypothetical protein